MLDQRPAEPAVRSSEAGSLKTDKKRRWWAWLAVGLGVAAIVAAAVLWGPDLYELLSDEARLKSWLDALGFWGPLAIVFLQAAQVVFAPIPGQAIGAASGYLYGPWLGTLFAMLGIVIGSIVVFLLARRFGRPLAIRIAGDDTVARLDKLAERGGALFFFLLWLFPFTPDDLVCLAAGLTPMPWRQFLLLMVVGRLPGVAISVWVGAYATQVSPVVWVVLLVLLAAAALAAWRWGSQAQDAMVSFLDRFSSRRDG